MVPLLALTGEQRAGIVEVCTAAFEMPFDRLFTLLPPSACHVLASAGGHVVGHAVVTTRALQVGACPPMRTAYLDAVATLPSWRRRGVGSALLRVIPDAFGDFQIGGLSTSLPGFYERLGWERWQGPTFVRTAEGSEASPPETGAMILRLPSTPPLDLTAPLSVEWRSAQSW